MIARLASTSLCCLLCVSAARAEILFQDNFQDGNADGWSFYEGTWSVVNNTLRHEGNSPGSAVAGPEDLADVTIEAEFQYVWGPTIHLAYRVLFHVQDIDEGLFGWGYQPGHYYAYELVANDVAQPIIARIVRIAAGEASPYQVIAQAEGPNGWWGDLVVLKLEVSRNAAMGFMTVNGVTRQMVGTLHLDSYPAGQVGVSISSSGGINQLRQITVRRFGTACDLPGPDCNTNGVPDACDVARGDSPSCNGAPADCVLCTTHADCDDCEECTLDWCMEGRCEHARRYAIGRMDSDADGDIDLQDYAAFLRCFGGPGAALPEYCDWSISLE